MIGVSSHMYFGDQRANTAGMPQPVESTGEDRFSSPVRRVLIVEFRDEMFADLQSLFKAHDIEVSRATSGAAVAERMRNANPNLALVNEAMPLESGWLITCKMRLAGFRQLTWVYSAKRPQLLTQWQRFCGVDEVISYGGVLASLDAQVQQRLERCRCSSAYLRNCA